MKIWQSESRLTATFSFLQYVRSQEVSIKVLESFVGLSKQLGLNTTLEGIETEEARHLYSSSGIESFQGFLFSKPLSSNDFEMHYIKINK